LGLESDENLKSNIEKASKSGQDVIAKTLEQLHLQIWDLLPAFCNYPTDIDISFKSIAKKLNDTLLDEPELRKTISTSIQYLIQKKYVKY